MMYDDPEKDATHSAFGIWARIRQKWPKSLVGSYRLSCRQAIIGALGFFTLGCHLSAGRFDRATADEILGSLFPSQKEEREDQVDYDSDIRNQTLGFQSIFVLNLPARGDRLDAFTLSSSLSGFVAEVAPGVLGETVPGTALPSTQGLSQDDQRARNAVVGTWRAHVDIARKIVEQRLASALIIEDDSDWDVTLKDRLVDFAHGSRYFSSHESSKMNRTIPASPYGDDWDMLWLGHCSITECPGANKHATKTPHPKNGPAEPKAKRFIIEGDPFVPEHKHRLNFHRIPNLYDFPENTRAVFRADFGICLYAYALSYTGAVKVLRAQLARKTWEPIDIAYGQMCEDQANPFNCIGVFPQLVDSHRAAGAMSRDSNIDVYAKEKVRSTAYTANIVYSTRLNIDRLLKGQEVLGQRSNQSFSETLNRTIGYRAVDLEIGTRPNLLPIGVEALSKQDRSKFLINGNIDTPQPSRKYLDASEEGSTGLEKAP